MIDDAVIGALVVGSEHAERAGTIGAVDPLGPPQAGRPGDCARPERRHREGGRGSAKAPHRKAPKRLRVLAPCPQNAEVVGNG